MSFYRRIEKSVLKINDNDMWKSKIINTRSDKEHTDFVLIDYLKMCKYANEEIST